MADSSEVSTVPEGGATPPAPTPSAALPNHLRLQELFVRGQRCLEKGDYKYAHDLFTQCVAGDPAQLVYVQHFRANLAQLHSGGKKSSGLTFPKFGGGRGSVLKAAAKGDWHTAFTAGCQALRKSPADIGVLSELAEACGMLDCVPVQLYYLHWALDVSRNDLAINRQAAAVLEGIGEFDQAIGCWDRV